MIWILIIGIVIVAVNTLALCKIAQKKAPSIRGDRMPDREFYLVKFPGNLSYPVPGRKNLVHPTARYKAGQAGQ